MGGLFVVELPNIAPVNPTLTGGARNWRVLRTAGTPHAI